jgi:hypothetical protein
MPRDSNIPLFLWIATAVLAHLAWGGGADRASRLIQETLDIGRFAASVQNHVRKSLKPVEVTLLNTSELPEPPMPEPEQGAEDEEAATDPEAEKAEQEASNENSPRDSDQKKKPEPVPPEPEKAIEPPKLVVEQKKPDDEKKEVEELPELDDKKRIAVRQHVKDENQQDNPEAEFIADQANRVEEQSQARITSTDQNDVEPTPGGNHAGPTENPGNASETRVAQSEDRPGEPDRAPDEQAESDARLARATPAPARAGSPTARSAEPTAPKHSGPEHGANAPSAARQPAQSGQKAQKGATGAEPTPDTMHAEGGSWAAADKRVAQQAQAARMPKKRRLPPQKRQQGYSDLFGFGSNGTTENGVNLNLSPSAAVAAIGRDKLARERRVDAERRLSQHRGSWRAVGIEKWRSAIENYVPSVKPGNQTALNTARVPFATYLNTIHNRLHPIFADSFLASLNSLPSSHPMNRDISTNLEIVLHQEDGRVVRMGVTKTSGVTAFDIAALESVQRASPFGAPPREIVSPDGNVYFHWEFWRNQYYACSTYFARPYMLKVKPQEAPPSIEPPPTRPYDENESPTRDRHGRFELLHVPAGMHFFPALVTAAR